jgi:pre-rRNA-processing protein TSR1
MEHRHRAGSSHQSNKPFKSRHATKGALREASKGKINRTAVKQANNVKTVSKADRRHAAKIIQQKKREDITRISRIFEGRQGAPKIVPVLPLCPDSDVEAAIEALYRSLSQEMPAQAKDEATIMNVERFKQKIQFVPLKRNFIDVIDAFKVADFGLLLMSADVEVDQFGINCLLAILNQGIVNVVPVVQNIENTPVKLRTSLRKSLVAFIQQFFPEEEHLFTLDTDNDCISVLRYITAQRPKPMSWRDNHPYMLAEQVAYDPVSAETGVLKVTGYARGNPFNANRLVHLQNFGDFQIQQITSAAITTSASDMQEDADVIDTPNPAEQDDLIAENEPDLMGNEQTWPTEEELAEADARVRRIRNLDGEEENKKRVPKGTSSYQAAWIFDDDDADYSEEEEEDGDMVMDDGDEDDDLVQPASIPGEQDDEEYEEIDMDGKDENADEFDAEEEARQYEEYLKKRQEEYQNHTDFPDEIDTPTHMTARERFARYRGLQSFRTSPWDPYENLPIDYGRIFQFENFGRTKMRVVSQAIVGNVKPGRRVTVWISNVPIQAFGKWSNFSIKWISNHTL